MSLIPYKQKRSAERTPEPFGGKPSGKELVFVIQKHAASHLHYDFRLEMEGVLKSWAVPKGPSLDPSVKRLAMMVEDHPFDYRTFEGIIPEGEYGGGTVIVWDQGTYKPDGFEGSKKEMEQELMRQLASGNIKFELNGEKLKGSFALVRTKSMGKNSWLLLKHDDAFATQDDVTALEASVRSGLTLDALRTEMESGTNQKRPKKAAKNLKSPGKAATGKRRKMAKSRPPENLMPMLATLAAEVPTDGEWLFEVKWDGYRALASGAADEGVLLYSRNGISFNERFPPIAAALAAWNADFVIDGEIVVEREDGRSDFAALQNWRDEGDGALVYYVFDLLWYDGRDLRDEPLTERKKLLAEVLPDVPDVRLSEAFDVSGEQFLNRARKLGLEGIMAKKATSNYNTGDRSANWLKIKIGMRQELIVCGYTRNGGTSKPFSSLLLGVYEEGHLRYAGKVGTGFSIRKQEELLAQFKKLERKRAPFEEIPDWNKDTRFHKASKGAEVVWLKPEIVCEVSFTERTADGVLRHPSFEGLRDDKPAAEVRWEQAEKAPGSASDTVQADDTDVTVTDFGDQDHLSREADGHLLELTNLQKVYWPESGITKGDMLRYYESVAPYMLPYLEHRPLSLNRYPNGIKGAHFYQKDMTGQAPEWADLFLYRSADEEKDKHFILGNNMATMLFVANLGCIEFHPWSSRVDKPDYPDWCIIDLDPGENSFQQVVEAANVAHDILSSVDCPCYCKTSGASGLHIYIPLGARYTYEQSKEFAHIIVNLIHAELPDYTTLERSVSARKGRMYLDYLQNRAQATIAAPYSIRPEPYATVSMPLHWEEVNARLKVRDFSIRNALERIQGEGDLFRPVLGKGIPMQKILKQLTTLFEHNSKTK